MNSKFLGAVAASFILTVTTACGSDGTTSQDGAAASDETVAAAQQYVEQVSQRPTAISLDAPLSQVPPQDLKPVFLKCPVPSCVPIEDGLREASELLGWDFQVVGMGATPEEQNGAFDQALQRRPDAIFQTGGDAVVLKSSLEKTKQAGIPVIAGSSVDEAEGLDGNGIIASINGPAQITANGEMLANWIVADSEGAAAEVAVLTIAQYPILGVFTESIEKNLAELCEGCGTRVVNVDVADIGKGIPNTVVSTIQQNPNIKYVMFGFGSMTTGVAAQLREAGLTDVKIGGQTPSAPNLQAIEDGSEHAWVGQDGTLVGWRMIDAFARHAVGDDVSIANETTMPNQLILKGTYDGPKDQFEGAGNYAEQFAGLWGVQ